jgi:hypothetical protein
LLIWFFFFLLFSFFLPLFMRLLRACFRAPFLVFLRTVDSERSPGDPRRSALRGSRSFDGKPGERAAPDRSPDRHGKSVVDLGARPIDIIDTADLQPLAAPGKELKKCLLELTSDQWAEQCAALDVVRRLAKHHPELITPTLSAVAKDVLHCVGWCVSTVPPPDYGYLVNGYLVTISYSKLNTFRHLFGPPFTVTQGY